VELGECANEWRGFKKWSHDQEPRTTLKCPKCNGKGYIVWFSGSFENNSLQQNTDVCEECGGIGEDKDVNPLLEEYVDALHLFLSIGLELGVNEIEMNRFEEFKRKDITEQFLGVFSGVSSLSVYSGTFHVYDDVFSAFLALGESLGFSWEQIEEAYLQKNAINHARQDSGVY
jgi:dimeric dUTPase (all-alpha-NTP-PPase superfamily)